MATETPVTIPTRRGERLAGVLHGTPGEAMAVSCHGMLSNKEGEKHRTLARTLAAQGIATLRFDFAGLGGSEGSLMGMSYSREMEDLDAAIDFLWQLGGRRFGVFGSSMGGSVALLTAARDERIVAIATLAAVGHPARVRESHPHEVAAWEGRGYVETVEGRIGRAFLDDSLSHDVIAAVGVLRAPILVVHGDRDEVVPCADAHDIAAAARNASLELVEGADHRFSNPVHQRPAMQRIANFLADHLL